MSPIILEGGQSSDSLTLFGPCGLWPFDPDCCSGLPDDVDPALIEKWQAVSTKLLWMASGQRYGTCEVTVRPCALGCIDGGLPVPYKGSDGAWRNFSACGCRDSCSCVELSEILLEGPVNEITAVWVDGAVLDPSEYEVHMVHGGWRLVRRNGLMWPACSDPTADCDDPDAFCVVYTKGIPLDELAIQANSALTCNLVKACIPNCKCALPANVASVVRRGVAISFDTGLSWIRSLPMVAGFLDAVNPKGLISASDVWSPDLPPSRITSPAPPVP